jgi:hypothetical protein
MSFIGLADAYLPFFWYVLIMRNGEGAFFDSICKSVFIFQV